MTSTQSCLHVFDGTETSFSHLVIFDVSVLFENSVMNIYICIYIYIYLSLFVYIYIYVKVFLVVFISRHLLFHAIHRRRLFIFTTCTAADPHMRYHNGSSGSSGLSIDEVRPLKQGIGGHCRNMHALAELYHLSNEIFILVRPGVSRVHLREYKILTQMLK